MDCFELGASRKECVQPWTQSYFIYSWCNWSREIVEKQLMASWGAIAWTPCQYDEYERVQAGGANYMGRFWSTCLLHVVCDRSCWQKPERWSVWLKLMASWLHSRVPMLFKLCLCTAAFFDQVPVSNIEDLSQLGCNQDFLIDHEPLQNFMCEMSCVWWCPVAWWSFFNLTWGLCFKEAAVSSVFWNFLDLN